MSTNNISFYEKMTKIIFQLSSYIIKYAPYLFFCLHSDCTSSLSLFSFSHYGANIYIEPRYEKTGLGGF